MTTATRHFDEILRSPLPLWGSFAAGFLFPPLFAFFVLLGLHRFWTAMRDEYADVAREARRQVRKAAGSFTWRTAQPGEALPLLLHCR